MNDKLKIIQGLNNGESSKVLVVKYGVGTSTDSIFKFGSVLYSKESSISRKTMTKLKMISLKILYKSGS